jgi:CTP synthase (UTP-ammonia lyase)
MIKIALLGDYDEEKIAHQCISPAIQLSADALDLSVKAEWIDSDQISIGALSQFDGIWCVPGSPYQSREKVINSIRFARESSMPFFGSCGGYQHAALEIAINLAGLSEADNTEENPDCKLPLISALQCALIETTDSIRLKSSSRLAKIYGQSDISEGYHCSYGINIDYLKTLESLGMKFVGHDSEGDLRAFELSNHPFFIGTAFQPERSSLTQKVHPLISAFLGAASQFQSSK